MSPDPTPSPTPEEIAEQGVDESVSRFIGRLHEQIRTLTAQVEKLQRERDEAKWDRSRCRLHPDGSSTGTGDGGWQCDQCGANDQYRARYFDAEDELARLRPVVEAARPFADHINDECECDCFLCDNHANLIEAALDRLGGHQ